MENSQQVPRNAQQLILNDPVLWSIIKVTHQKTWRIVLLALAVYGGAYFGLGWLSSTLSGVHFYVSIFNRRELIPIIMNFFVVAPIIWVYYTQESMKITRMFDELSSCGIFSTIQPNGQTVLEFFRNQIMIFNTKKRYLLILILITIVTIILLIIW